MPDDRPLVWLPFGAECLGEPSAGLRYQTVVPTPDDVPESAAGVEFYVPAYQLGRGGATPAMWPRAYRLVRRQLERFAVGEPVENVMAGEYENPPNER